MLNTTTNSVEEKLEQELMRLIKSCDERFLELVFKLYYSKLCSYANTFIKVPDLAEEIVQETLINFWENRASLKIDFSFKAYIFRSVHNNCINYLKKNEVLRKQYKQMSDEIVYHNEVALQNFNSEIIDNLVSKEIEIKLNFLLDSLPYQSRKIFMMNRFDHLSYSQIAKELNLSLNTIKTQMKRALKKIRGIL